MDIYCLTKFKEEIEKLLKKNSYSDLESEIIDYFFGKTIQELKSGDLLNSSDDVPYIKKRLKGKGGYRVYFLLIIKNDCLYLLFVHPKTGTYGTDNITNEAKKTLLKEIIAAIKSDDLFEVKPDSSNQKLLFNKKIKATI